MKQNKFRSIIINKSNDDFYTIVIQQHKKFLFINYWSTIRILEHNDKQYLITCVEEILDALNMQI